MGRDAGCEGTVYDRSSSYCEKPRDLLRYGLVLSSLVLALLSKPIVVTLPFVLLLLDYWPLARLRDSESAGWPRADLMRKAVLEKLPLFALVLAASIVTYIAQAGAMEELEELGLGWRLANGIVSYWIYISDVVWPSNFERLTHDKIRQIFEDLRTTGKCAFATGPFRWPELEVVG